MQRVSRASVSVGGETIARIGRGALVLVGIERGDGPEQVVAASRKLAGLRIYDDGSGRMNLDLAASAGELLVVSQFTLLASTDRGRRPSFERAAEPARAAELIERLESELRATGLRVASGRFGATMSVELTNDGPVTLVLDFRSNDAAGRERSGGPSAPEGHRHEGEQEDRERHPG